MDFYNPASVNEEMLKSSNIFNLLANLFVFCETRFTDIFNLIRNRERFNQKFHKYRFKFFNKLVETPDIFTAAFPGILDLYREVKTGDEKKFLVKTWAFLKALDAKAGGGANFFISSLKDRIECPSSPAFGGVNFLLLFKPKNFILKTIRGKKPGEALREPRQVGQRIHDFLDQFIFYREELGRKIEINRLNPEVDQLLALAGEDLAFAVSPIAYNYDYSFRTFPMTNGTPFIFSDIDNSEQIGQLLIRSLKRFRDERIHIVVFPELSLDGPLREKTAQWLKNHNHGPAILMVVAGSYHFPAPGEPDCYENKSIILGYDGRVLWEQAKMNQFQFSKQDIEKLHSGEGFSKFKKVIPANAEDAWEKIEISDLLRIYDSSIGRFAAQICLDFIVRDIDPLLINSGVNIVLAPTMSPTLGHMRESARRLGIFGHTTLICANSCWMLTGGTPQPIKAGNTGFIYFPQKNSIRENEDCQINCDCCRGVTRRIMES